MDLIERLRLLDQDHEPDAGLDAGRGHGASSSSRGTLTLIIPF